MIYFFVCLVLSVSIGAWRSAHMHPERPLTSSAWSSRFVRATSFGIVTVASVWIAKELAALTAYFLGETAGLFSFGGWLVLRWQASVLLSFVLVEKLHNKGGVPVPNESSNGNVLRPISTPLNGEPSSTAHANAKKFPNAKVLFVDGESTLRRRPDGNEPEGIPALQTALRRPHLTDVLLVACGHWKDVLSLTNMRALFDDDIAVRIVDRTPQLEDNGSGFTTHREIFAWLEAHPEISNHCFLGPFYCRDPHIETGVFVHDGRVFGEDPRHVSFLEKIFVSPEQQPEERVFGNESMAQVGNPIDSGCNLSPLSPTADERYYSAAAQHYPIVTARRRR